MRKPFFAIVLSIANFAASQIQTGTVIIFNGSKDKLVVAADSRALYGKGARPPDDSQCKIATFNGQTLFTTGGNAVRKQPSGLSLVGAWTNVDIARQAVFAIDSKQMDKTLRVSGIADQWATALLSYWKNFNSVFPQEVLGLAEKGKGILTYGIFAEGHNGVIYLEKRAIILDDSHVKVATPTMNACSRCGQSTDFQLCAFGRVEVPVQVCGELDNGNHREATGWLRGNSAYRDLAIGVAKMTATCNLDGSVGGPIDAIELQSNGRIMWLQNTKKCPEN